MKTKLRNVLSAVLVLIATNFLVWPASAALISFTGGMNGNCCLGLENNSDSNQITQLDISLASTSHFDTTTTPPGIMPLEWSVSENIGGVVVNLPSNESTDGQQEATITFGSFDPGDLVNIIVDYDRFGSADRGGLILGSLLTVTFDNGDILSGPVEQVVTNIGVESYDFGVTVTNTAVPVPAAVWLFGCGLLGMIGLARRKKTA